MNSKQWRGERREEEVEGLRERLRETLAELAEAKHIIDTRADQAEQCRKLQLTVAGLQSALDKLGADAASLTRQVEERTSAGVTIEGELRRAQEKIRDLEEGQDEWHSQLVLVTARRDAAESVFREMTEKLHAAEKKIRVMESEERDAKKLRRRLEESSKRVYELGAEVQRLRGKLEGKIREKIVVRPARPQDMRGVRVAPAGEGTVGKVVPAEE